MQSCAASGACATAGSGERGGGAKTRALGLGCSGGTAGAASGAAAPLASPWCAAPLSELMGSSSSTSRAAPQCVHCLGPSKCAALLLGAATLSLPPATCDADGTSSVLALLLLPSPPDGGPRAGAIVQQDQERHPRCAEDRRTSDQACASKRSSTYEARARMADGRAAARGCDKAPVCGPLCAPVRGRRGRE